MSMTVRRGQVYLALLDPVIGSEQGGRRPVVVVSNNMGNRHGTTIVVVPVSTSARSALPTHVRVGGEAGLSERSVALCEQVRTVDKKRLLRFMGRLGRSSMALVGVALETELGLAQDAELIVLCPSCADDFREAGSCRLRRVSPNEPSGEFCSVCATRRGYEYVLSRKPIP